jgi:acyl-CoA thioesterase
LNEENLALRRAWRCNLSEKVFEAIRKKVESEPYAKKLGLKLRKLASGYSLVEMTPVPEMDNIFGMVHGGAIFSLIDEAFETASNSHGTVSVALQVSISYLRTPAAGATLFAEAKEVNRSRSVSHYEISVRDEEDNLIATSLAMAYRKKDPLPFLAQDD